MPKLQISCERDPKDHLTTLIYRWGDQGPKYDGICPVALREVMAEQGETTRFVDSHCPYISEGWSRLLTYREMLISHKSNAWMKILIKED